MSKSSYVGIRCLNASKFGETFPNGNAEPSLIIYQEGVETLHLPSRTDEDKVQTTNFLLEGSESYSSMKILWTVMSVPVQVRFPAPYFIYRTFNDYYVDWKSNRNGEYPLYLYG